MCDYNCMTVSCIRQPLILIKTIKTPFIHYTFLIACMWHPISIFTSSQVPPAVMSRVLSLRGSGVLPVAGGEVMGEGLRVRVDRAATFRAVLAGGAAEYLKPLSQRQGCVVLNCPALHPKPNTPSPDTMSLGQLRTVLLADHMGALLRRQGWVWFNGPGPCKPCQKCRAFKVLLVLIFLSFKMN